MNSDSNLMDNVVLVSLLLAFLVWLVARWLKHRSESHRKLKKPAPLRSVVDTLPRTQAAKPAAEIRRPDAQEAPETEELSEEEAQALLKRLQDNALEENRRITQATQAQEERRKAQHRAQAEQAERVAREAALEAAKQAAALKQAQEQAQRLHALAKQQQEKLALERARQEAAQEAAIQAELAQKQAAQERAQQQALEAAQQEALERAEHERQLRDQLERERAAAQALADAAALQAAQARRQAEETAQREAAEQAAEQAARQAAQQAALEAARQEALRPPPAVTPQPSRTPEQIVVMVADDSKVVRVKAGRLLAKYQYQVVLAQDGADAVQQMAQRLPDVLITDVEMPGMDGFELTRHVRSNPLTANMHIIMITAADDKHREAADAAGVNVLLGKPYEDEELISGIERGLNLVS